MTIPASIIYTVFYVTFGLIAVAMVVLAVTDRFITRRK